MNQSSDALKRIRERFPHLSRGQKMLANYILEHYDKAVYLTASHLGELVGVSESTVVRFANELGYDGYPGLQKSLEELVKTRLTTLQRLEVSKERVNRDHILSSVLQSDRENLKATLENVSETEFRHAVDLLKQARRIYILGVRSCAALASFLGFYLNFIMSDVRLIHTNSVSETFEQMLNVGPQDVFVGISFPRYSKRTVKVMEFAKSRGSATVAITDSQLSPLVAYADSVLMCQSNMISFADSLVAPLSVINAVIVALSQEKQGEIRQSLSNLETIWKEYDVYDSADQPGMSFIEKTV